MADVKENLKLLFDRPSEPLFTPKRDNKLFQLTSEYLPPEYESNGIGINNRFGDDDDNLVKIPLKKLRQIPDLSLARRLRKDDDFSLFVPYHQQMAAQLIDVLMSVPKNQLQDFLSTCAYARCHCNPQLFNYCFSVALLHREDTRDIPLQNYAETFPFKFLESKVFGKAREITDVTANVDGVMSNANQNQNATRQQTNRIVIPRDYTATDRDPEHRIAYFREDIGVNLHHWHWHLVYPFQARDRAIVDKDRRGELFFYMHQQIIARYNVERFCNQLPRAKQFNNWNEPIPEAYYPKLDNLTTSRAYAPRQANMRWQDVNRPAENINATIRQMETWRTNLFEAISTGQVQLPNGSTQPLTIDILGNLMEASILSPNRNLYGDLHNAGHIMAGYIHDPNHRYLENMSIIADEAANMRDPFFYRWHAFVDDVFQKFKETAYVRPYIKSELDNPGVSIRSVQVSQGRNNPNVLETYWMRSDVDLTRGLDFSNRGTVYARFTHLNHDAFTYTIEANNSGSAKRTTVRIFLGPKFDESNGRWHLNDQRKMFIELDRFVVQLQSGSNRITRNSTQSAVTIPFEQTFRDLSAQGADPSRVELASFNFCGCGWPQHLLIPRGNEAGYQMELFVMLSNHEFDKVDQPAGARSTCDDASSFCGIQDSLYPDRRSMGYPFDRPSDSAADLRGFLTPNMAVVDVLVRHRNNTVDNPRNPTN